MNDFISFVLASALLVTLILFVVTLLKPDIKINKKLFRSDKRKKLAVRYLLLIVALFVGIGIVSPGQSPESDAVANSTQHQEMSGDAKRKNQLSDLYDVIEVVDGDTIKINIDGKTETLRLIGINTPETKDPRKPVQCFGEEASGNAKELLEGKKVRLERDDSQSNRDKYDRLLRYVYLEDGTSYNKQIITDGYAHEYTYDTAYKYQEEYKQAQKDAEAASKGLWSPDTCNGDTEQAAVQEEKISEPQPTAPPTSAPTVPEPSTQNNCDPNYSGGCVPNVSYDLDCSDISFSVTVVGTDHHRFDRDKDGYGCESN